MLSHPILQHDGDSKLEVELRSMYGERIVQVTPLQKRMQVRFWLPIKIPAEYVIMMPGLPENAKSKIFHGGTLNNKFQE